MDVDFCNTHLLLIIRNGRKYELYSLSLPLANDKVMLSSDPSTHAIMTINLKSSSCYFCLCISIENNIVASSLLLSHKNRLRICYVWCRIYINISGTEVCSEMILQAGARLKDFNPRSLPLPDHVSQILPGSNYDFYSSTMRFTITSPVVCK